MFIERRDNKIPLSPSGAACVEAESGKYLKAPAGRHVLKRKVGRRGSEGAREWEA